VYEVEHLIGGDWVKGQGELIVVNPATDEPVTRAPVATKAEVERAVAAARASALGWARTPAVQRGAMLREATDAIDAKELADVVTAEMGNPDTPGGVQAGIGTLREYAATVHRGRSLPGAPQAVDSMIFEPRGVVAAITPWNDPVAVSCGLIGAALATGNTVVYKPSERTPATGWLLAKALSRNLPPGVLNMLSGNGGTGAHLAAGPVDVVAHVGSTATGRAIAKAAAETGAKTLLENGGNDPLIVDSDVDPRWAAQQAALGAFANAGQICVAVERIYVHHEVGEAFLAALVEIAQEQSIGPLVDRAHREKVHAQVRDALVAGARALCGASIKEGRGAYYPPTVLSGCTDKMEIMREETFGPVAPVAVVASFDEALERARAGPYGLAATVLTASMRHALRAVEELPVGTLKINEVFGGAPGGAAHPRGISGQGFGYGPELLDEMTFTKVLHIQAPPA
jgi:acyl-CoA reductase-like NAD-dependent aldehyde dehydrogenase